MPTIHVLDDIRLEIVSSTLLSGQALGAPLLQAPAVRLTVFIAIALAVGALLCIRLIRLLHRAPSPWLDSNEYIASIGILVATLMGLASMMI